MTLDDFALVATTSDLSVEATARAKADFVELPLYESDSAHDQLETYSGELPIIVSAHSLEKDEGLSLDELHEAAKLDDVEIVDIPLDFAEQNQEVSDQLREDGVKVIVSYFNTSETPDLEELSNKIEVCTQYGNLGKVATFAQSKSDTLTLLRAIELADSSGKDVAGVALGETGRHTRIAAPFYGSKLGYAPMTADSDDAKPGQIPLNTLAELIEETDTGTEGVELMDVLKDNFPPQTSSE